MSKIEFHQADAIEQIMQMEDKSVDAIITDPDYDSYLPIEQLTRVCKGNILVFCAPEKRLFEEYNEVLHWIKPERTMNYAQMSRCGRFVENILVKRQGTTFNMLHWSQMSGIFFDRLIRKPVHPYQKPLSLIMRLIHIYTKPGDLVLDPYLGSGTTMIACSWTNRNGLGFEINKKHYQTAKERYETENKNLE